MGFKIPEIKIKLPEWLKGKEKARAPELEGVKKPPRRRAGLRTRVRRSAARIFQSKTQRLRKNIIADYKAAVSDTERIDIAKRAAAAKQYNFADRLYVRTAGYIVKRFEKKANMEQDWTNLCEIRFAMEKLAGENPGNKFLKNNHDKICAEMKKIQSSSSTEKAAQGQTTKRGKWSAEEEETLGAAFRRRFDAVKEPFDKFGVIQQACRFDCYKVAAELYIKLAEEAISKGDSDGIHLFVTILRKLPQESKSRNYGVYFAGALEKVEAMLENCRNKVFKITVETLIKNPEILDSP